MRINIFYKDDKIIIESSKKYINLDELFLILREKYAIDNEKRLILLSETIMYKEDEYHHNHILESSLPKSKEDFVLVCLDDYNNFPFKRQSNLHSSDSKYSKENLIMKITGASNPIKQDKKIKPKGRLLRNNFFNNFDMSNLIGYQRYDILSNIEDENRSDDSSSEQVDTGIINRYGIPTLLGRIRERDHDQPVELSLYAASSSVREEDINRLVNEMGFPDNSVRIALRMTRNNLNRAVDLLLNNPEELTEENLQNNRNNQNNQNNSANNNNMNNVNNTIRNPQSIFIRNQSSNQTNSNNNSLSVIRENSIANNNSLNRSAAGLPRNFDDRSNYYNLNYKI
jgi:hypothetical protein